MRDMFAISIAGAMLSKAELQVDSNSTWTRKMDLHSDVTLRAIAFMAYKLADKMLAERVKKD